MIDNYKETILVDTILELINGSEYVSEIATNGPGKVYYKEKGVRREQNINITTEEEYLKAIDYLIEHSGLSKEKYLVEGRYKLPGARFGRLHIAMPPASTLPLLTLAIKTTSLTNLTSLQGSGSFDTEISKFLKAAVGAKLTMVISGGTGAGKALHKDTYIPTPSGFKRVNELNKGDLIFDEKGQQTQIVEKYCPHDSESFDVVFSNGEVVKASSGHLWKVSVNNTTQIISTKDILNELQTGNKVILDKVSGPVDYNKQSLPVDPYIMGEALSDLINQKKMPTTDGSFVVNSIIPLDYRISDLSQRKAILEGLVNKVGTTSKYGLISLSGTNEILLNEIREIILSLGWFAYLVKDNGHILTLTFTASDLKLDLGKKTLESIETRFKKEKAGKIEIEKVTLIDDNPEDYFCFQVDSASSLFLCTKSFIPTHNTTLLEALTSEFDFRERVGVCEDSPELLLKSPNTVYLNSTVWRPGLDTNDVAPLQWIVQQINRMRVDRIIIGETRGMEFFDFVTAANSGAEGSLTTIHANDGSSAMKKMATFVYMSIDMSPRIINEMISQAVDVVIQLGKNKRDGSHKIISIHEVTNAISSGESPTIALNPLFTYDHDTNKWEKRFPTDQLKRRLETYGYNPNTYTIINKSEEFSYNELPKYFKKS